MSVEAIVFEEKDLEPIVVPVTIGKKEYELREADEDTAVKYRNASISGVTWGQDGSATKMENIGDVEPLLVSLCLREVVKREGGTTTYRPVTVQNLLKWKPKVVRKLFETAKEISNLNEEDTEEGLVKQIADLQQRLARLREDKVKNSQSPTPGTSG